MAKAKSKLDRKTRRAIENAIRQSSNYGNSPAKATSSSISFNSSGYISGFGSSIGSGLKKGTTKEPVELPAIVGELHVSRYFIDDLNFHLRVFNSMMPQIDYTMVARVARGDEFSCDQMCFYSADDRDTFEGWMDSYLEKFGKHTDLLLPAPLEGEFPHTLRSNFERKRAAAQSSSSLNAASSCDDSQDQMLEQWLWILENCEGEARHAGTFWFFADKGDATLFKLAYS